jgi:hypothetical protein
MVRALAGRDRRRKCDGDVLLAIDRDWQGEAPPSSIRRAPPGIDADIARCPPAIEGGDADREVHASDVLRPDIRQERHISDHAVSGTDGDSVFDARGRVTEQRVEGSPADIDRPQPPNGVRWFRVVRVKTNHRPRPDRPPLDA